MPCQHQAQLYQLLEKTGVKLASSDVIRITCRQCGEIEVCPSVMLDEYEKTQEAEEKQVAAKVLEE